MNELLKKINFISRFKQFIKSNYKYIIILFALFIIILASIQSYHLIKKNNILKASIKYNNIISNFDNSENKKKLNDLENDSNFYGILSKLAIIKIDLKNNNIELAYEKYLELLNNKNLDSVYKSLIAINASYSFLEEINLNDKDILINPKLARDIIIKINNLILNIDDNLENFIGYKFEILYLIAIINDDNKILKDFENSNSLYQKIIDNDKVSSTIKERVKKINDTQKYK